MPHRTIFMEKGYIRRFFGTLTFDDFYEARNEVWGREDWDQLRFHISDLTGVTQVVMSPEEATGIAYLDEAAARSSNYKRVALITDNESIARLCRNYIDSMSVSWWEVRLFDNREEAILWASEGRISTFPYGNPGPSKNAA